MDCTHPVLYMLTRDGALVCHVCGAVVEGQRQGPHPSPAAPVPGFPTGGRLGEAQADEEEHEEGRGVVSTSISFGATKVKSNLEKPDFAGLI